ncbi:hypothetical protein KKI24_10705 [bacterium]|nr:hypothetical protein [bacterium]
MILITPWDSLPDLAQSLYWYLPVKWLARDRFDSVRNLKSFTGKTAVLIAEKDEIIPPKHSMRLYESISVPKRLWEFENAGHNSWPSMPDESWWQEVMLFIADG